MTNIAIPAAIYESVEKYDQAEAAKMRQLQQKVQAQQKRNILGTPDYLFNFEDGAVPRLDKADQKKIINALIKSPAGERFHVTHYTPSAEKSLEFAAEYSNSLSDAAKDYLAFFSFDKYDPAKDHSTLLCNSVEAAKAIFYAYKKIWVGMYFPQTHMYRLNQDVLINYTLMFKVGSKASNLNNMQLILEFAERLGYGQDNPVVFDEVTSQAGDTFYKVQLVMTKEYKSDPADLEIMYPERKSQDKAAYNNTTAQRYYVNKSTRDIFWQQLYPFLDKLSIKLNNILVSKFYENVDWMPLACSDVKLTKLDFYPYQYRLFIGNEYQPDAKRFIRFIYQSLKASLARTTGYLLSYQGYLDMKDVLAKYNFHEERIEGFIQKINTPKFRSVVHKSLSIVDGITDEDAFYIFFHPNGLACHPINYILDWVQGMFYFHCVWPDAPIDCFYATLADGKSYVLALTSILNNRSNAIPIDHYGTVQDKLSALINSPAPDVGHDHHLFNIYTDLKLASWLQQKINPLTFIGWIEASIAEAHAQEVQRHPSITNKSEIINSRTTSYIRYYCQHTITDTLNMLAKYIQNAPAFENFRCSKKISLHNFEQELIEFSINNSTNGEKLEALPMDLFSEPVEVEMPGFEYGDKLGSSVKTWKFLQPKTTKHLRIWGDAIRNCVGSTTTYYTNMKKHKALIILACIDNKPRITIYAQLRDQKLEFDQVRDKMNTVLNDGQTYMLQQALMRALAVAAESRQALV